MKLKSTMLTFLSLLILSNSNSASAEKSLAGQRNLVEIGVFGGIFWPSDEHELYQYPDKTQQPFKELSPEIGLRVAYLPLSWLGLEVEGAVMPTKTDPTTNAIESDDALIYTARGHLLLQLPLSRYFAPFLLAGGGLLGVTSDQLGDDVDGAFHWGGGFKIYATDWLALRFDGRHTMESRVYTAGGGSSHQFEVLGGLSMVLGWDKGPPPDRDGDGVPDASDRCPDQASSEPDGCPPPDRDGDGVRDENDKCPDQAAATPDGCPPDRDGDGVLDEQDKCPDQAGTVEEGGCPPPADSDHDGILDPNDKCPNEPETVNGYQDADGCPDDLPKEVKKFTGAIVGITFDLGRATIRRSAYRTLDEAVGVLNNYPELNLKIRGHTDSSGSLEKNMKLSLERAEAVKDYLVGKGVSAPRLSVQGVGPNEPIADNGTKAGRNQNRRIEFKLVENPPPAPVETSEPDTAE